MRARYVMMKAYVNVRPPVSPESVMRQYALPATIALAGASAVLLGAYGAHGLSEVAAARDVAVWRTAVRFQFWHVLALGLVALSAGGGRSRGVAAWAFAAGIVLFCGSLYALALGAPRAVGFATPAGGVAFVVGWVALGIALGRPRRAEHRRSGPP